MSENTIFELFLASLLPTTAPFVGQVPTYLAEMVAGRFLVGHTYTFSTYYIIYYNLEKKTQLKTNTAS